MKYDEAVRILAETYRSAPHGEKTVAVHLFGIRYAEELSHMDISHMDIDAIGKHYDGRIREGMKLAKWVKLKDQQVHEAPE